LSVIAAPLGKHSQKPDVFRDLIAGLFPTLPKIEMFAREAGEGWDAWGAEAPDEDSPATIPSPLVGEGKGAPLRSDGKAPWEGGASSPDAAAPLTPLRAAPLALPAHLRSATASLLERDGLLERGGARSPTGGEREPVAASGGDLAIPDFLRRKGEVV
jgi:hypothetical protein